MQLKEQLIQTKEQTIALKAEIVCMTEEMNSMYRILQEETEGEEKHCYVVSACLAWMFVFFVYLYGS